MLASEAGDLRLVKVLLDQGADVNAGDLERRTPIAFAAQRGFREVVEELLSRGADPSRQPRSEQPPHFSAAFAGHAETARVISRRVARETERASLPALAPRAEVPGGRSGGLHTCSVLLESRPPHIPWLWLDSWNEASAPDAMPWLHLTRTDGSTAHTNRGFVFARPDVVAATGRPELLLSGYRFLTCLEGVAAGDYLVQVLVSRPSLPTVLVHESSVSIPDEGAAAEELRRPVLVSVHIPKTAGLSFADLLGRQFSGSLFLDYTDLHVPYPGCRETVSFGNVLVPAGVRCVHGHFLATKYERALPLGRAAVWLREPGQRLASHFQYASRQIAAGGQSWPWHRDLLSFVSAPPKRNDQTRFLDGRDLATFDFVGIVEEMDRSLALYGRVFGGSAVAALPHVNANPDRVPGGYLLPTEVAEAVASYHAEDVALYRRARERFEALCRAHGL